MKRALVLSMFVCAACREPSRYVLAGQLDSSVADVVVMETMDVLSEESSVADVQSEPAPDIIEEPDECSVVPVCGTCIQLPNCGFCKETGRCLLGTESGPRNGTCMEWAWTSRNPGECDRSDGGPIMRPDVVVMDVRPDVRPDVLADVPPAVPGTTVLVSATADGTAANGRSTIVQHSVSADGRYVVFTSEATNLAAIDDNGVSDVFLRDTMTEQTTLISHRVTQATRTANGASYEARISADGEWVLYLSRARNLTTPTVDAADATLILWQRSTNTNVGVLRLPSVSLECADCGTGSLSADGRYFTYRSSTNHVSTSYSSVYPHPIMVYRVDRTMSTFAPVRVSWPEPPPTNGIVPSPNSRCSDMPSTGGADSFPLGMNSDGSLALFWTRGMFFLSDDIDSCSDTFYRTFGATSSLRRIPTLFVGSGGADDGAVSGDGSFFVIRTTTQFDRTNDPMQFSKDLYLFPATAMGLGTPELITRGMAPRTTGDRESVAPSLSLDGSVLSFASEARNLVSGDSNDQRDVFVYERTGVGAGRLVRASIHRNGTQLREGSGATPALSADGNSVVFTTTASALFEDSNNVEDVYVRRWR